MSTGDTLGVEYIALPHGRASAMCDIALNSLGMELTDLQAKHDEIKDKVAQLGRFL